MRDPRVVCRYGRAELVEERHNERVLVDSARRGLHQLALYDELVQFERIAGASIVVNEVDPVATMEEGILLVWREHGTHLPRRDRRHGQLQRIAQMMMKSCNTSEIEEEKEIGKGREGRGIGTEADTGTAQTSAPFAPLH